MKEELELTDVMMILFGRIEKLENRVEGLLNREYRATKEVQFVASDQIDLLATKVEQNLAHKLQQLMRGEEKT